MLGRHKVSPDYDALQRGSTNLIASILSIGSSAENFSYTGPHPRKIVTTLYAATSNPGKLREFATAAAPANIEILPLLDLANLPPPEEDAPTFAGNAALKAVFYSQNAPNLLVFADDSGLEVDALHGQPGVLSARFADILQFEPNTALSKDERNNRCLLHELKSAQNRTARFVCNLALARNGQILLRSQGTLEGEITSTPQGTNGFGYDPLFLLPNRYLTLAQIPPGEKWSLSHRGNAFRNLLAALSRTELPNRVPHPGQPSS